MYNKENLQINTRRSSLASKKDILKQTINECSKVAKKQTPKPLHININGYAKDGIKINNGIKTNQGLNLAMLPKSSSQAELRPRTLLATINQKSTGNLINYETGKKVIVKKQGKKLKKTKSKLGNIFPANKSGKQVLSYTLKTSSSGTGSSFKSSR
jgi:hypothetical protein